MDAGHIIIICSVIFFIVASYAVLFSAFLLKTGIFVRFCCQFKAQSFIVPLSFSMLSQRILITSTLYFSSSLLEPIL
jgi:hypothetical protein